MPHPNFVNPVVPPGLLGRGVPMLTEDGGNPYFPERNFLVSGITRDATGALLPGCVVKLFNTATDLLTQASVSDANGAYTFVVDKTQTWYVVSYKAGSPDVAGTTINTLVGV